MKQLHFIILVSLILTSRTIAQSVAINTDGSSANASSILDIKSTAKGLLIPRMTTAQRTAIASPAKGLIVFDITTNGLWYHNGSVWNALSSGSSTNYWSANSSNIYNNTAGNVGIGSVNPVNKLQIGAIASPNITGNDIAIGNGTQAMSFFQATTNSAWYTTTNFALLPGEGGTGNLGIGTTTPATKLTVQTLSNNYGISHTDGTINMTTYIGSGFGWIGTKSNHPLGFFTNNSLLPQMILLANGHVGIGTLTPSAKLTIHTSSNTEGFSHESDGGIILKDIIGGVSAFLGTYSNHTFKLVANSVAVINIEPAGNVGIGVTDAVNKLQIGSVGATGFNGNDIAIGNGTNALGIFQSNTATTFASTTDIILMPGNTGHGRVGINTTTPRAPLDVVDNVTVATPSNGLGGFAYFTLGTSNFNLVDAEGGTISPTVPNVSIFASNRILATEFDAYSDARIKNITGVSNSTNDLQIINAIKITDYTMKDRVKYGSKPFKKVIAQEVEKIYPQVISKHTDFIPNVYQLASKIEKITGGYLLSFDKQHSISNTAKKLRVLFSDTDGMQDVSIISIPSATQVIIAATVNKSSNVFVYGEEVSDFRSVDYEGLSTLNISATQELSKLIIEQNKKIAALEDAVKQLTGTRNSVSDIK